MQETFPDGALYFHWGWPDGNEEDHDRWYIERFEEIATGMKCLHDEYQSQKATMVCPSLKGDPVLLVLFRGERTLPHYALIEGRGLPMQWIVVQCHFTKIETLFRQEA